MNTAILKRQMQSGAVNFYWIAGLSIANAFYFIFSTKPSVAIGLGITQFLVIIFHNIAQFYPNSALLIQSGGLLLDAFICSIFVLCGYFAGKGHRLAFITGMIIYGLDTILTFVSSDFFGFGFHLFFLWFLFSGLRALNQLKETTPEYQSSPSLPKNN